MELEPKQSQGDGRRVLHTPRVPGLSPDTKDEGRSDRRQRPCNCVLDTEAPRIQREPRYRDGDTKQQPTRRAPGPPRTNARAPPAARERRQHGQAAGRRLPALGGGPPPPLQNQAGRRTPAPSEEPAEREAAKAERGTARTPQRTEVLTEVGSPTMRKWQGPGSEKPLVPRAQAQAAGPAAQLDSQAVGRPRRGPSRHRREIPRQPGYRARYH